MVQVLVHPQLVLCVAHLVLCCSPSHHIKVVTSMAVAVARKRPDMWVRSVHMLFEIMEREIKRKELKEETVERGKDGGVEQTIVQSLLKLVSKNIIFCRNRLLVYYYCFR